MNITGTSSAPPPEPLDFAFTGLSTTTNAGNGGAINVSLTGDLSLTAAGGIKADTQGTGSGGTINLAARNLYSPMAPTSMPPQPAPAMPAISR